MQRNKLMRRPGDRSGAAILELAITLALLLNLTFGMIEFGYFFYVKNSFSNASREGARAGMVPGAANSDVTTAVTNALISCKFPASSVTTAITDTSGNPTDVSTLALGTSFEVTVSATWSVIGNGFRPLGLISASKVVTSSCVMRKE